MRKRDARVLVQLTHASIIPVHTILIKVVACLLGEHSRRVSEQPSSKHPFYMG